MAWPPSTGFQATRGRTQGLPTSIAWGTEGLYPGIIVKSMRSSRMIDEIRIENGTGLTTTQVLINDGDQVEITVVDDRSLTFPDSGTSIQLLNPITPTGGVSAFETFIVVNNDYNAARKQEGERVLLCKAYTLGIP